MIVIAIIGILAAALFPSMSQYIARANNRALIEEMQRIGMAANMFHMDFGRYSGDTQPSNCNFFIPWAGSSIPEFITRGYYPLIKYQTEPQKINPEYCFDWQNWDASRPWWASIEVYQVTATGFVSKPKVYCLYNWRVESNSVVCTNVGTE